MDENKLPEGFEIPIHRSLSQPFLIAGLPRVLFFIVVFFGVIGLMFFKSVIAVGIAAVLYVAIRYFAHKDPQFHKVIMTNKNYKSYYFPG